MNTANIQTSHGKLARSIAASILLFTANQVHAIDYTFHDLGTAGGPWSFATAINNAGQITGLNQRGSSTSSEGTIFTVWNGTTPTTGEHFSTGFAINSSGTVAGVHQDRQFWDFAAVFNGNTRTDLGDLAGRSDPLFSSARGINDSGQIVGYAKNADNTAVKPILWNNSTTPTVLDTLGGQTGRAFGINNAGYAVGFSFITGNTAEHATRWNVNDNTLTDLNTLGGTDSRALAINTTGEIVGWSDTTNDAAQHAVLWNGGSLIDLNTLGGINSQAKAINNTGQIVGWSEIASGVQHATLWDGNTLLDLNNFLDPSLVSAGWVLKEANGINDHGAIVGTVINRSLGINDGHAFLLTAVPVPGAVWLFGTAIAGLIGVSCRKSRVLA